MQGPRMHGCCVWVIAPSPLGVLRWCHCLHPSDVLHLLIRYAAESSMRPHHDDKIWGVGEIRSLPEPPCIFVIIHQISVLIVENSLSMLLIVELALGLHNDNNNNKKMLENNNKKMLESMRVLVSVREQTTN